MSVCIKLSLSESSDPDLERKNVLYNNVSYIWTKTLLRNMFFPMTAPLPYF